MVEASKAAERAAEAALADATQVTTVYVGKIPDDVHHPLAADAAVQRLLSACGPVRSWRRVADPATGRPKAFGFCDFASPAGVAAAVAALGPADVGGGRCLRIAADERAQAQVDAFFAAARAAAVAAAVRAEAERRAHLPPGMEASDDGGGGDEGVERAAVEAAERAKNDAIAAARARVEEELAKIRQQAAQVVASPKQQLPAAETSAAGRELAAWKEKTAKPLPQLQQQQQQPPFSQSPPRHKDRYQRAPDAPQQQPQPPQIADHEHERARRDRERREREFREFERQYEVREQERLRRLAAAVETDPVAELAMEERSRRRHRASRRERAAERKADEEDRRREEDEARRAAERRVREEKEAAERKLQEERRAREQKEASVGQMQSRIESELRAQGAYGTFLPVEPSYDRGFRFTIGTPTSSAPTPTPPPPPPPQQRQLTPSLLLPQQTPPPPPNPAPAALAVFGDDSAATEKPPRKRLIKLDDDEDEQEAPKPKQPPPRSKGEAVVRSVPSSEIQKLVEKIPTAQGELFAWRIDWEVVDRNSIIEQRMRPWTAKKIAEYLGEEDQELVNFIVKQLSEHQTPEKVLEQLRVVLEEDAPLFVIKMWRMLIFEILSASK